MEKSFPKPTTQRPSCWIHAMFIFFKDGKTWNGWLFFKLFSGEILGSQGFQDYRVNGHFRSVVILGWSLSEKVEFVPALYPFRVQLGMYFDMPKSFGYGAERKLSYKSLSLKSASHLWGDPERHPPKLPTENCESPNQTKKKTGAKKYTCPWCLSPFKKKLKILKNMQLGRMLSTNHWSQGFFLPLFKLTKSLAIWKNRWHLNQHKKKAHFLPSFSLPDFTSIVGWLPATMKSWRWCQIQGQASSNARWQYWQGCNLATFRTAVAPVFLARFFLFRVLAFMCMFLLVGWLVGWSC